jgi:hypothetical protein
MARIAGEAALFAPIIQGSRPRKKKRGVFVGGVGGARFGAGEEGVEVAEGGVALRRVIERELLSYPELPPSLGIWT